MVENLAGPEIPLAPFFRTLGQHRQAVRQKFEAPRFKGLLREPVRVEDFRGSGDWELGGAVAEEEFKHHCSIDGRTQGFSPSR